MAENTPAPPTDEEIAALKQQVADLEAEREAALARADAAEAAVPAPLVAVDEGHFSFEAVDFLIAMRNRAEPYTSQDGAAGKQQLVRDEAGQVDVAFVVVES